MDPNMVVKDILDYVDWQYKKDDPKNLNGPYNFVFGNIAFSHDGEDKINIGEKMVFGEKDILWTDLMDKNNEFGCKLNVQECFSITKFLKNNGIKVFSLSFVGQDKTLRLIPFDKEDAEEILEYQVESSIPNEGFGRYRPCYFKEYPAPDGVDDTYAVSAFKNTLKYYNEFHQIVNARYHLMHEGYIYLIRPKLDLGGGFAALAYMYLWHELDVKDMEIISQKLSLYFLDLLKQKVVVEAIKSAKAAIMSRNLSHNLGSHVMSYLKQNFNSVQEIIVNGTLETVIEKDDKQGVGNNNELPLLVGMGKFISYLQERQDYIATVSTDYIPCQSVVNFKDAIYDELNPDYRFYRHKDNWRGHKPANILLQNIAKSEGLSRELLPDEKEKIQKENNIIIQFRGFNGIDNETDKERRDFEGLRSYNFSIPGGIMGRQAVFSIVENVIRNAAKHGSRQDGRNLELTFDIYDAELELDQEYSKALDKPDLYVVTLTDNVKTEEGTIDDINKVIKKSFYDEGTDLTASNKGIKEMIISAAWLRGIKIEEKTEEEKTAPILRARRSKEGCLQYVFCLPKVKKVAYLTSDPKTLNKDSKELNRLGWYILDVDKYKNLSNRSFSFVLLDNSLSVKYEEIRHCSNNRLFIITNQTNYNRNELSFEMDSVLDSFDSFEKGEDREMYLKEIEKGLFKQMALSCNDESIRIAISEANTEKIESDKVKQYDKESAISGERYIYRTHNDSTTAFLGFLNSLRKDGKDLKEALDGVEFIEGITGGNSTDRIVRREVKDDLWVYQQIHAMKTRVAVFDERIFARITGYETSKLKEEKSKPIDWGMKLKGKDLLKIKNDVNNYDCVRNRRIVDLKDFYENWSEEKVIHFAQENYPSEDSEGMLLKTVLPLVYRKKGIDVYTMTKINEENNCFAIWAVMDDFSNINTDTNGNEYKNNIYGHIEKIAELWFDENCVPRIKFSRGGAIEKEFKRYDYVTIHQGLLDKVYQKMPIRDSKNEFEMRENKILAKRTVTKEVFDKFIIGEYDKDDYLPGLAIHSGRSKPNKMDMPQNQPFIQYSAMENAVMDCKYTLVELLDFASYE